MSSPQASEVTAQTTDRTEEQQREEERRDKFVFRAVLEGNLNRRVAKLLYKKFRRVMSMEGDFTRHEAEFLWKQVLHGDTSSFDSGSD